MGSDWVSARELSECPQLVALGNYVAGGVEGVLHDGDLFAVIITDALSVEAARPRAVWAGQVGDHRAALIGLTWERTGGVEASPQEKASNDQEQNAAGHPYAHSQLPACPVVRLTLITQCVEHLALPPGRIGCLTRHTQEVGGLGEEVAQVHVGLSDRDAGLVHETLALVAHQQAVPVGVIHDAIEGVYAARGRGPAHPG